MEQHRWISFPKLFFALHEMERESYILCNTDMRKHYIYNLSQIIIHIFVHNSQIIIIILHVFLQSKFLILSFPIILSYKS